jgi:hypothetical protein
MPQCVGFTEVLFHAFVCAPVIMQQLNNCTQVYALIKWCIRNLNVSGCLLFGLKAWGLG